MEARIEEFVKIESNIGSGKGSGFGNGAGCGEGSGFGDGYGYNNGSGFGNGSGSGKGYGCGWGSGFGDGYGYGYNYGSGFGNGAGYNYGLCFGIEMFNNQQVRSIDNIPTIITNLKGNIAKGFILNGDFTLSPCFVVKHNSIFAHGETLHEALQALESKLFDEMEVEEKNNRKFIWK